MAKVWRLWITAWVIVTMPAVLAGCGSSADKPRPLTSSKAPSITPKPPSSASASPSRSPSPTAQVTAPTAASAEAFVRGYFDALTKAAVTGHVEGLSSWSTTSCAVCRDDLQNLKALSAKGQHVDGPLYQLTYIKPYAPAGRTITVTVKFSVNSVHIVDASGRQLQSSASQPETTSSLGLLWINKKWVVTDFLDLG